MADLVILWNKNTVCIECRISGEILYATALYVLEVTQVKISCHGWMTYDNTATGDQSRILAPALPFFGEPPWFVAPTDWALYRPWTKKVSYIIGQWCRTPSSGIRRMRYAWRITEKKGCYIQSQRDEAFMRLSLIILFFGSWIRKVRYL